MGLWVRAGSWCCQQLTDGIIPGHIAVTLGTKQQATALVSAGLWDLLEDGSYSFHDWDKYQPSAAEVRAERQDKHEKKVAAGRAGGLASGVARRKHTRSNLEAEGEANAKQNEAPTRTRPEPLESPSDSPPVAALPERFDEFWQAYPRRVGKGQAVKAWKSAVRKSDPGMIITAAISYAATQQGKDPQYVAHPATWLNGERWLDEAPSHLRVVGDAWYPGKGGSWDV